jgi:hypothetical protein
MQPTLSFQRQRPAVPEFRSLSASSRSKGSRHAEPEGTANAGTCLARAKRSKCRSFGRPSQHADETGQVRALPGRAASAEQYLREARHLTGCRWFSTSANFVLFRLGQSQARRGCRFSGTTLSGPGPAVLRRRGLTPRSRGAPTAGHQARAGGTRYIFTSPGLASCRCHPLSSNVRPHRSHSPFRLRLILGFLLMS